MAISSTMDRVLSKSPLEQVLWSTARSECGKGHCRRQQEAEGTATGSSRTRWQQQQKSKGEAEYGGSGYW